MLFHSIRSSKTLSYGSGKPNCVLGFSPNRVWLVTRFCSFLFLLNASVLMQYKRLTFKDSVRSGAFPTPIRFGAFTTPIRSDPVITHTPPTIVRLPWLSITFCIDFKWTTWTSNLHPSINSQPIWHYSSYHPGEWPCSVDQNRPTVLHIPELLPAPELLALLLRSCRTIVGCYAYLETDEISVCR